MVGKKKLIVAFGIVFVLVIFGVIFVLFSSGSVCRRNLIIPMLTGLTPGIYEFGDQRFLAWKTTACVVNVGDYSNKEVVIELGYFDRFMRMHTYLARLGGESSEVGYCTTRSNDVVIKCETVGAQELANDLIVGETGRFYVVLKDKTRSIYGLDQETEEYGLFLDSFKNALIKKNYFPGSRDILQISQVEY